MCFDTQFLTIRKWFCSHNLEAPDTLILRFLLIGSLSLLLESHASIGWQGFSLDQKCLNCPKNGIGFFKAPFVILSEYSSDGLTGSWTEYLLYCSICYIERVLKNFGSSERFVDCFCFVEKFRK